MNRRRRRSLSCALILVLLALGVPAPGLAAGTTLRGVVLGAAQAPLAGVRVMADEIGVSRDTDVKGRFSLTVSQEAEKRGIVRLTFSLADHQTLSLEIKLPLSGPLEVTLTPLYARTFQPPLPPALAGRLRVYRKEEIRRVHDFLGSKEKKLLSVEGLAGVGSADLLLVALQDVPKAARRPILWWDCEEGDSLTLLAEEWARAFHDQNLGNLVQRRDEAGEPRDHRALDRETLARLLARFERTPHTIVLNHFDRWLSAAGQGIEEPSLTDFLSRAVAHPQGGKLVLLSEVKPALPHDLNPDWTDVLVVKGLVPADALDFLRGYLGLKADPDLLREAAGRLGGHPFALQLLAGSLTALDKKKQEDHLRQFLQVGESTFGGTELGPLLAAARAHLTPLESQILDVSTVVHQPLTAGEIQEIGVSRDIPFTAEEVRIAAGRLARERYWLESFQDVRTSEERFRLAEVARPFLEERIGEDRAWKAELHRRAFAWYQKKFPVAAMDPMVLPQSEEVTGYDELLHQAFSLAELTDGEEKQLAILVGAQVVTVGRDWHVLRESNRLLLSQLKRAERLLEGQSTQEGRALYASTLMFLGDLYVRTDRLDDAETRYQEALPLFRAIEHRLGEATTLWSLGDLYVRAARLADAEKCYEEALPLYRAIGSRLGEANTLRSLGDLYVRTARLADAEKRYEEALPLFRAIEARLGEANTLRSLGDLCVRTERLADAEKRYEEALPLYRAIEARLGEATTLWSLGDLYVRTARLADAEKCYEEALPLYRAIESRLGEANTLRSLGDLYVWTERLADAAKRYEEALPLFRAIQDRLGEANTLKSLGDLYVRTARLADAAKRHEEALPLFRAIQDRLGEANVLMSLGNLYTRTDRLADAEKRYEEALPLFRAIQDRLGEANTLRFLGDLYMQMDRSADAEKRYAEALPLFRVIQDRLGEANTLRSLGDVYVRTDRLADAEKRYEEALPLFRAIEDRLGEANTLKSLGDLYVLTDRFADAEKRYEEVLPLFRAIQDRLGEANTLLGLGDLRAAQSRVEEAEKYLQAARTLYLAIDEKVGQFNSSQSLSELYRKGDRAAEALREALAGFLIARAIERDPKPALVQLIALRQKIGQEAFESIAKPVIGSFPTDDQGTLVEVLTLIGAAFEKKAAPGAGPPAETGSPP